MRQPAKSTGVGRCSAADRGVELYPTPEEVTLALLRHHRLPKVLLEPAAGMGHMVKPLEEAGHIVLATDLMDYGTKVCQAQVWPGIDFVGSTSGPPLGLPTIDPSLTPVNTGVSAGPEVVLDGPDVVLGGPGVRYRVPHNFTVRGYGAVITNPPFSLAADFVRVGLQLAPEVVILARLAFLEGQGRRDILDHKLRKVLVFENRLPMMHRWSPDQDGVYQPWSGPKSTSAMSFAWFVFNQDWDGAAYGTLTRRIRWEALGE